MNEKVEALIRALYDKSVAKQVVWEKTSGDSEFKVTLDSGATLTVDSFVSGNTRNVDVSIYNIKGEKIFYYSTTRPENSTAFNLIQSLNSVARDLYFKVDETIDGILNEIESKQVVGKETNTGEDELPF